MTRRPGFTLLEAMSALFAGAFVTAAVSGLLQAQGRLAMARSARAQRLETARVAATVLGRELRLLDRPRDLAGWGGDTLAARFFRGLAVTCAAATEGGGSPGLLVLYAGSRVPDPTKDSVLPLSDGGLPAAVQGVAASMEACLSAPGAAPARAAVLGRSAQLLRLDLGEAAYPPGTALLVFQHGVYALSSGALRFRHGREGRQPLTGELLDDRRSALRLALPAASPETTAVQVTLGFKAGGAPLRLQVPFSNAARRPRAGGPP